MKVTVVDYGAGNIRSVANVLDYAGADAVVSEDAGTVANADRLILPGVGAAGSALEMLRERGLDDALREARERGRPILGICLGLQLLSDEISEFGSHKGFGWIPGRVGPIEDIAGQDIRTPHIGWAHIAPVDGPAAHFFGRNDKSNHFYFCHSNCLSAETRDIAATTAIGDTDIVASVHRDNVLAVQFHPEKSQINGVRLVEAFLDWTP